MLHGILFDEPLAARGAESYGGNNKIMSLPTSYMTSVKRLPNILEAIQTAKAPKIFSTRFLEQLGFSSKGDRLIIGVLKDLGFLDDKGVPKEPYYNFLDQTHSETVLAEGVRAAWKDLFAVNVNAHELEKAGFVGKLRTLSEGQMTDKVMGNHFTTFSSLVKIADFTNPPPDPTTGDKRQDPNHKPLEDRPEERREPLQLGGLVYNIQIVLPESRDPAVYDVLFRSMRDHLL